MGKAKDSGGKDYLPSLVLLRTTPQVREKKSNLLLVVVYDTATVFKLVSDELSCTVYWISRFEVTMVSTNISIK